MEELDKNKRVKEEHDSFDFIIKAGKDSFEEKENNIENKIIKYIKENQEQKVEADRLILLRK